MNATIQIELFCKLETNEDISRKINGAWSGSEPKLSRFASHSPSVQPNFVEARLSTGLTNSFRARIPNMARKRYEWTEARIAKFAKEGRGSGVGPTYKPWLTVSDVSSLGLSHRIAWKKTDRTHHLLSDNEYYAFLRLSFEDDVVDIREQFPLNRDQTLEISAALKVRHPANRGIKIVMTTDLLVTRRTEAGYRDFAYAVKESSALLSLRTIQKLEIERIYWACRNIPFSIMQSSELKDGYSRNLAWIFEQATVEELRSSDRTTRKIKGGLREVFQTVPAAPLRAACGIVDRMLDVRLGQSLETARRLLGNKELLVDLNLSPLQDLPCSSFSFARDFP